MIALSGAIEIAPAMQLADLIVDIVDTGSTLRANGLEFIGLDVEMFYHNILDARSNVAH